jgi:hypothetical protein
MARANSKHLVLGCIAVFAAVTLAFIVWQNPHRLPEYVEAFCLHNARRIKEGLPLYVDPTIGASEWGLPPSRWFVGYAAPYAALLSFAPLQAVWGRSLGMALFLGTLLYCARRNGEWSMWSLAGAGLVVVSFRISQYACSARPDPLALACAGIAYARTLRADRVDTLSAIGFGLAVLIKPNIVSLGAAAMLFDIVRHKRFLHLVPFGITLLTGACILHLVSHGEWLWHMKGGTAPSLSFARIGDQLRSSGPFVLVPVTLALLTSNIRAKAGVILAVTLAAFQFAKLGGAPNYWLESTVACVAALAWVERPRHIGLLQSGLVFAHLAWNSPILVQDITDELRHRGIHEASLARIRLRCGEGFIFSSDLGVEWALNRRIHTTPLEVYLQRTPVLEKGWTDDIKAAKCFVVDTWPDLDAVVHTADRGDYPDAANAWLRDFERIYSAGGVTVFGPREKR